AQRHAMRAFLLSALQVGVKRESDVLAEVVDAFKSDQGLLLHVGAPGEEDLKQESPVSFSALRWDLPPALFTVHEQSDASGFVLHPSEVKVNCAYPVDGDTSFRSNPEGQKDPCGRSLPSIGSKSVVDMSGNCTYASEEEYAQAYFNKPRDD
ncbi:unnamed protein product, partial [Effrenium voratum]